jgi:hypothetical protein
LSGIAEASSDFDKAPGRKTNPARRNANQIPGPITAAAKEGSTNKPEPMLAATVTIITPTRLRDLSRPPLTSLTTPEISPFRSLFVVDLMSIESPPKKKSRNYWFTTLKVPILMLSRKG